MLVQKSDIIVIQSGGHSDRLVAKIMCGTTMQKSSQGNLLSSTTLLESFEDSVGTNDVNPSSHLTSESVSSSRMLNALAALSRPALVKYQRGT